MADHGLYEGPAHIGYQVVPVAPAGGSHSQLDSEYEKNIIFAVILPVILGFFGMLFTSNFMPQNIFDKKELEEFDITFKSSPLMNIIVSNTSRGFDPLFGRYKGLEGGHKYDDCNYIFSGTCASDRNRNVYCPSSSSEDSSPLDQDTCIDFYGINAFDYTKLKDRYYYADKKKTSFSYKDLLNSTVNKHEECPKEKQNCGYLNKESKLCLSFKEDCPINDIVINNNSTYSYNNITYKSVILGNDYIHYTNEKIENQIIFDLLISIENPLSKIETKESNYDKIFKLHEAETDIYYNGNIDDINAYNKIYNTGITLKELYKSYNIFDTIQKEPNYKTEYYNSDIFVYKKYPVPLNGITEEDIKNMDNLYKNTFMYNILSCALLITTLFCTIIFAVNSPNKLRFVVYPILTLMHIGIFLLFYASTSMLLNRGILIYYEDKDFHRIQLLLFFISYMIMSVLQNLYSLYRWIATYRELEIEKEKKNESFLENENKINYNNNSCC